VYISIWENLWLYRELLYFLTWRDVKAATEQTLMGAYKTMANESVDKGPDDDG